MNGTTTHTIQLVAGPLHMRVSETPDALLFSIEGAKPLGFERRKLQAFFFKIADAYREDGRRMEVRGARSKISGHVDPVGGGLWKGAMRPIEGGR